jgi:hypothetical protein
VRSWSRAEWGTDRAIDVDLATAEGRVQRGEDHRRDDIVANIGALRVASAAAALACNVGSDKSGVRTRCLNELDFIRE